MFIGAMDLPHVWQDWDQSQLRQHMETLAEAGINTFLVESDADVYDGPIIDSAHYAGLRFFGGLNCFYNPAAIQQRPDLYPIDQTGLHYPVRGWYDSGVIPTDDAYNAGLVKMASTLVSTYPMDGFLLNFIRWPLFWEYELRPDTPDPNQTSFDKHTLQRFQAATGITLPTDTTPRQQINWLLTHHAQQWTDFKCDVITSIVRQIVDAIRAIKGTDFPIGLANVPALPDVLEPILGQRLADLAPLVDFVLPMTYHAILHQPYTWIESILDSMRHSTPHKLVPFVLSATQEGDGSAEITDSEWESMLRLILSDADTQGLVLFTASELLSSGRNRLLKQILPSYLTADDR